ncbi:MAG TPA: hypothetical protein VFV97_01195 [Rhodanobacteraceae bacterium]|nr:hypothetical protein [Rhodanobacteraceae bacterium]
MYRLLSRFSLFAFLAAGALSASAATPAFVADVAFKPCEGLICFEASLDGAPARTLMLDTGNAHSTLIADVARNLQWTLQPAQRGGSSVGGIFIGGEHRVAIGAASGTEPFFVFERAMLGIFQPPVDGSLSYDFFKDRVLEIDYPHHRLRFTDPITTPVPADTPAGLGTLHLINFGERGPPVVVGSSFTVDGHTVRAQIDTVFTGTMLIYDNALGTLGLSKNGSAELFRYTDGGVELLAGRSNSIGFGQRGLVGGNHTLYFVGEGKNPVHQPDGLFDATVGNALFANCVVTLDFHAMTFDVRTAD